jgi:hypothetical protein
VHFLDRLLRAPLRPIAIGIRIEVRFKDWFQQQLGGYLHHPSRTVGIPSGRSPPPGFGIITRRTACG